MFRLVFTMTAIERADSVCSVLHPFTVEQPDSAVVVVRNGDLLREAMSSHTVSPYLRIMVEETMFESRDPADYSFELSRNARGVEFWLSTKLLGEYTLTHWLKMASDAACQLYAKIKDLALPLMLIKPQFCVVSLCVISATDIPNSAEHDNFEANSPIRPDNSRTRELHSILSKRVAAINADLILADTTLFLRFNTASFEMNERVLDSIKSVMQSLC